ncbi:MAG: hypothetical protein EZS28_043614 [Streblomastix strix]|uniref:Uncharacterized protein n=1 Tax=Streblomastix strix TaxID=222440 RepID=A0A5J4TTM0_9EUKA|nr:MAG: hypothetical protein EZS28_043614 [Streblomastix strix]
MVLFSSIHLRTIAQHKYSDPKARITQKNNGINLMGTCTKAQSPFVFDQPTTSKLRRISEMDHTSLDYQTSVMEWLDSLIQPPKYTNQYLKQQQVQSYSQQNKSQNQKRKVMNKSDQRTNQIQSQQMEQMTMETKPI